MRTPLRAGGCTLANQNSDLGALPLLSLIPFVNGTDLCMPADTPACMNVTFDGRTRKVPNWPSQSEGHALVMLQ